MFSNKCFGSLASTSYFAFENQSKLNSLQRDSSKLSINSLCSPSSTSGISIMTDSSLNCSSTGSRRPEIGENRSVTGSNSISSISSSTKKKKICFDGAMKKIVNETDAKVEEFEKWMLGSVLLIVG